MSGLSATQRRALAAMLHGDHLVPFYSSWAALPSAGGAVFTRRTLDVLAALGLAQLHYPHWRLTARGRAVAEGISEAANDALSMYRQQEGGGR